MLVCSCGISLQPFVLPLKGSMHLEELGAFRELILATALATRMDGGFDVCSHLTSHCLIYCQLSQMKNDIASFLSSLWFASPCSHIACFSEGRTRASQQTLTHLPFLLEYLQSPQVEFCTTHMSRALEVNAVGLLVQVSAHQHHVAGVSLSFFAYSFFRLSLICSGWVNLE